VHNPTGLTPNIKIKTALTPVGVAAGVMPAFPFLFDFVLSFNLVIDISNEVHKIGE